MRSFVIQHLNPNNGASATKFVASFLLLTVIYVFSFTFVVTALHHYHIEEEPVLMAYVLILLGLVLLVAATVSFVIITIQRLNHTHLSRWWSLLLMVPVAKYLLIIFLSFYNPKPEQKAEEEVDT